MGTPEAGEGPMSIRGLPLGWKPESELDHFMKCPVCGEVFDMRNLGQAMEHIHDGPAEIEKGPPARS